MINIYREVNAEVINRDVVVLNYTKERVLQFDIYFMLVFGLLLVMQVFSYNHQDQLEFVFTLILILVTILINFTKEWIWHKVITFNREKGTIEYRRNFPHVHQVFDYSKVEFVKKNKVTNHDGTKSYFTKHYMKPKYMDKKYLLGTVSGHNMVFHKFMTDYMDSDQYMLKHLTEYNSADDDELNTVFHL